MQHDTEVDLPSSLVCSSGRVSAEAGPAEVRGKIVNDPSIISSIDMTPASVWYIFVFVAYSIYGIA